MLTINANEEKMTLQSVVSPEMIQKVAEMIAISEMFGPRIDVTKLNEEKEKLELEKTLAPKKERKKNPNKIQKGKTKAAAEGSRQDFWVANGSSAWDLA